MGIGPNAGAQECSGLEAKKLMKSTKSEEADKELDLNCRYEFSPVYDYYLLFFIMYWECNRMLEYFVYIVDIRFH